MTSEVLVQHKTVVIPGEALATGMDYLPGNNTYREGDKIYSKVLGLAQISGRVLKVTALAGPYIPKAGDKVICQVTDIAMSGWRLGTNTAYTALLNVRDASNRFIRKDEDLSKIFAIGDYVIAQITQVTSQKLIDVSMREPGLQRINRGRVISVNPEKVPRLIGKQGSMIGLLKRRTGCSLVIGQNGLMWIAGELEMELLVERAVKLIQERSHLSGLTEQVESFLAENGAAEDKPRPVRKERESTEEKSAKPRRFNAKKHAAPQSQADNDSTATAEDQ